MQVVERGFLDQRQRVGEHGPALGRESRDEVGAERDARPQAARAAAGGERVGAAVPARHALQHEVVAGLDREMEMRHEARLLAHQTPEIVVDLHRIERGEAQPLERRHQYQQPAHELPQARPPRQIGAEAGDVDAGQHDLAMMQKVQRWSQPCCTWTMARARRSMASTNCAAVALTARISPTSTRGEPAA